jgi:organic radical activating enzyme
MAKTYKVNEIFLSLQGEGKWTGVPMVFLRFSLCNLHCPFCDTDFSFFREMTSDEILSEVKTVAGECRIVCLTGGEPSLQVDGELIRTLHGSGFRLHIETNGTRLLPEGIDWVTMSPKSDWNKGAAPKIGSADEVKVVYTGQDVSGWLDFPAKWHLLQPCSGKNIKETVSYCLSHPQWGLSLQTHLLLGIK